MRRPLALLLAALAPVALAGGTDSVVVVGTLEYRLWLRSGEAEDRALDWGDPAELVVDHPGGPLPIEVASNILEWELAVACGGTTTLVPGGFTFWAFEPVEPVVECPAGPATLSLVAGAWRR